MTRIMRFTKREFRHFAGVTSLMAKETEAVLYRFPVTVVSSVAVSGIIINYIVREPRHYWETMTPVIFALVILGLFAAAFRIFCDEYRVRNKVYFAGNALLIAASAGYMMFLRHAIPGQSDGETLRFAVLVVAGAGSVLCAPFILKKRELAANWAVTVGFRFVVSWFFSTIIYSGISIALLIIDALLGIHVSVNVYFILYALLTGVFLPVHFLSGVPAGAREGGEISYPRPLMILITYILLPLIGVYLAIIYVYFGKAIVTRSWPEGTAAYLILTFSIAGIFLLFAVTPIERLKRDWVSRYTTYFHRALIPLLPLLFLAIGKRVHEYGITEKRYYVILLALWLTGITLYRVISKKRAHVVIPLSITLCAILSVAGPWGAFNVSRVSQTWRLEKLLVDSGIIKNGSIVKDHGKINWDTSSDINDTIRYLVKNHGSGSLTMLPGNLRTAELYDISGALGIASDSSSETEVRQIEYIAMHGWNRMIDLKSCRYFASFRTLGNALTVIRLTDGTVIKYAPSKFTFIISGKKGESIFELKKIALSVPALGKYTGIYNTGCDPTFMIWRGKYKGGDIQIVFTQMSFNETKGVKSLNSADFYMFLTPGNGRY